YFMNVALAGTQPILPRERLSSNERLMKSRATPESETDAAIYNRHRDALIRYASALVGPSHAEDVLSTVVLRTLNRRSLSSLDRPDAYLFRAVLNESRSRMRRQQPVELPPEIGSFQDPDVDTTVLEVVM